MNNRNKSLLSAGLWLAMMQLSAAAGQLIGIRILTSVLPPEVFGETILWVGIVNLVSLAIANPTMQALLRYYPEYALQDKPGLINEIVHRQLFRILKWVLPLLIAVLTVALGADVEDAPIILLLCALILVEISRTKNLALLNAIHAHHAYGVWIFIEAWAKPLCAWLMITYAGVEAAYVIAGYLLATLLLWCVMHRFIPDIKSSNKTMASELSERVWKYTLPLLPLGLLGWLSGMSDAWYGHRPRPRCGCRSPRGAGNPSLAA